MGQEHIQTRVPSELHQQIEKYEEEEAYMNRAETIRHLLRAGLDAETEDDRQSKKEVVADGGAILRPIFRTLTALTLGIGLLGFVAFYVGVLSFGLQLALLDILAFTLSAFVVGGLTFLPLMTTYPERADEHLWSFSGQIRRKVSA